MKVDMSKCTCPVEPRYANINIGHLEGCPAVIHPVYIKVDRDDPDHDKKIEEATLGEYIKPDPNYISPLKRRTIELEKRRNALMAGCLAKNVALMDMDEYDTELVITFTDGSTLSVSTCSCCGLSLSDGNDDD